MSKRQRCPDCGRLLEFLGENGSFAMGHFVSSTDILICRKRHVWLRAHRPEVLKVG